MKIIEIKEDVRIEQENEVIILEKGDKIQVLGERNSMRETISMGEAIDILGDNESRILHASFSSDNNIVTGLIGRRVGVKAKGRYLEFEFSGQGYLNFDLNAGLKFENLFMYSSSDIKIPLALFIYGKNTTISVEFRQ